VAELHKVAAASGLPNTALTRLEPPTTTTTTTMEQKKYKYFFPLLPLFLSTEGQKLKKKYGHKTSAKILLRPHTDGEVHVLTS
jgi:hypothetical protein